MTLEQCLEPCAGSTLAVFDICNIRKGGFKAKEIINRYLFLHKAIIGKKQAIMNYLLRESANPLVLDKVS